MFVVFEADTIAKPRAMMIELFNAHPTSLAVFAPRRFLNQAGTARDTLCENHAVIFESIQSCLLRVGHHCTRVSEAHFVVKIDANEDGNSASKAMPSRKVRDWQPREWIQIAVGQ